MNGSNRLLGLCLTLLSVVAPSLATAAGDYCEGTTRQAAPRGYDTYAVFSGTGVMDPLEPSPIHGVTGCAGMFCDGDYFHRTISGRSTAQIHALGETSKAFYAERFGIDVDALVADGRIMFRDFTLNPSFGYRVFTFSDLKVPCEGFTIRDGGFMVAVVDPNGLDLGGEFAGKHVAAGTAFFWGNYNIAVTNAHNKLVDRVLIQYRSLIPVEPRPDGTFMLRCELRMPDGEWGDGMAMAQVANQVMPDGRIKSNAVNRLTFPPASAYDGL